MPHAALLRLALTLAVVLPIAVAAQAQPADAASAPPASARLQRIEALRAQRPNDGLLVYYQALTLVEAGRKAEALAVLRSLVGRGLGIVPTAGIGFEPVWDDAEFQQLRKQLADDEPRSQPDAPVAFTLRERLLIPEGIAYDAQAKRFFIGSLPAHKVIVRDANGEERDFSTPDDKLDAVLGLAVDAPRGRLCAVSTNGFEASAQQQRRNAVICWSLANGRRISRHDAPGALQFNDLAFGADGTIFVTDSEAGSLWRLRPGDAAPALLGEAGALRGANGIAVGAQEAVFVAISTGIARVDAASGAVERLPQPDNVVSGGIDGLYAWRGGLVGIQNVTSPGRVLRIALAPDGRSIVGAATLQSHHHPEFDEPTTGAVVGEALYVIANSNVGRYEPDGSLRDASSIRAARIIAVPLR